TGSCAVNVDVTVVSALDGLASGSKQSVAAASFSIGRLIAGFKTVDIDNPPKRSARTSADRVMEFSGCAPRLWLRLGHVPLRCGCHTSEWSKTGLNIRMNASCIDQERASQRVSFFLT